IEEQGVALCGRAGRQLGLLRRREDQTGHRARVFEGAERLQVDANLPVRAQGTDGQPSRVGEIEVQAGGTGRDVQGRLPPGAVAEPHRPRLAVQIPAEDVPQDAPAGGEAAPVPGEDESLRPLTLVRRERPRQVAQEMRRYVEVREPEMDGPWR